MNSKEIETAIDALLHLHGVTYSARLVGERTDDDWAYDEWQVMFRHKGKEFVTEYRTGTGHRVRGAFGGKRVVAPKAAGVFHSLCSDTECGGYTFEEFCDNLGYDTDSRKALKTYLACQEIGSKLRQLLGHELLQEISDIVAEY
jgi:hypothetical protein